MDEIFKVLKAAFEWLPLPDPLKVVLLVALVIVGVFLYLRNQNASGQSSD